MKVRLFGKQRWVFVVIDVITLAILGIFFQHTIAPVSPSIPLLIATCLFMWTLLYNRYKISFEYYAHAVKIFIGMMTFSVIYLHGFNNINSLFITSTLLFFWLVLSITIRAIINTCYCSEISLLTFTYPSEELAKSEGIHFTIFKKNLINEPFEQYDALVVDRNRDYDEDTRKLIGHMELSGVPVVTSNELEETLCSRVSSLVLDQAWLFNGFKTKKLYRYLKQPIETFLVVLFSPIILILCSLVSVAILVTMGRPILFNQKRAGQDGKVFIIHKFRTMVNNCDNRETTKNDTRITPLGKILRKTRLDEFPQFLNVLKGEMSLIGPRPEWVVTAEKFNREIPAYHLRQLVKPGITGLAQVKQGHTIGEKGNYEKQQYDLYYVKYFSPLIDIKILIKTFMTLFTGRGV